MGGQQRPILAGRCGHYRRGNFWHGWQCSHRSCLEKNWDQRHVQQTLDELRYFFFFAPSLKLKAVAWVACTVKKKLLLLLYLHKSWATNRILWKRKEKKKKKKKSLQCWVTSLVKSDNFSAIFDSLYLLYYIVDHGIIGTFMRSRGMPEPIWYRVSYPYVLWPLKWMIMSCTIFLVVAISAERHRAICSPLTHRPTFWPYVLMVVCTACKWQPQSLIDGHIRSSLSN